VALLRRHISRYTFQLKNYVTDATLQEEEDMMADVEEMLEALVELIDETSGYVDTNPNESKETYGARRAELQAAVGPAFPLVAHVCGRWFRTCGSWFRTCVVGGYACVWQGECS
jgi:hypothetical protein